MWRDIAIQNNVDSLNLTCDINSFQIDMETSQENKTRNIVFC